MRKIADMMCMNGRVAAVTGAAGHLGYAIAAALLEAGCNLILVDVDEEALNHRRSCLQRLGNVRIEILKIDLEFEDQRKDLRELAQKRFGRLDVLVNNAGFVGNSSLPGWVGPLKEQSLDTWRRAIEVNLTASFHLSQDVADLLSKNGCGSIINVASIYGILGPDMRLYEGTCMGNPAAYAASKGGLIQITRWLAAVMAPQVRVNAISPGGIARNQPDAFTERYVASTPLARMGIEEDFKGVALFLASDLSAWVTGQNIVVDGGWSIL